MPVFTGSTASDTLLGGGEADTLQGLGGNDLLVGSDGHDRLEGGLGFDTMIGGAGNDVHLLDSTADRVAEFAGGGADTIQASVAISLSAAWASQVEALVYTGAAGALLFGNDGDNRLTGAAAADTLRGGAGADTLDGGAGNDQLEGGEGDDLYLVGAGDRVIERLGAGRDGLVGLVTSLVAAGLTQSVENLFYTGAAGAGLLGNGLDNVMAGGAAADTLTGGDGADSLAGGLGADRVQGNDGDDVLSGGRLAGTAWNTPQADAAADTLVGGAGNDTYLITDLVDVILESNNQGLRDTVVATVDTALSRYPGVEVLVLAEGSAARVGGGSLQADLIIGNAADNVLAGGRGGDTLSAWGLAGPDAASPDVLDGGEGDDILTAFAFGATAAPPGVAVFGGAGNDLYVFGAAGLAASGSDSAGTDTAILFASADLSQLDGIERIVLAGATLGLTAADRLALAAARSAVDGIHAALVGGEGFEGAIGPALDATGSAGANTILGNAEANRLAGGGGDDVIEGAAGADTLDGGAGNDVLIGGRGSDVLFAETGDTVVEAPGGGFDIVHSTTITSLAGLANIEGVQFLGTNAVTLDSGLGNLAADFLGGGSGNDTIRGRGGNDTLHGGEGHDRLDGQDGDDRLAGEAGDDVLIGGLGDDMALGGAGHDTLDGGGNLDLLRGGAGRDVLLGGDGGDSLHGDGGADELYGEAQNDVLVGGGGNDTVFGGSVAFIGAGIAAGDILYGDSPSTVDFAGADIFAFDAITAANGITETFLGSGVFAFFAATTVADFQPGLDRIHLAAALVGDLDLVIDGHETADAAGDFLGTAELVFFQTPLADALLDDPAAGFLPVAAAAVDSVIGSATSAIAVNATRLFVLGDGLHAALLLFQSANGDAAITIDELYLVAVVANLAEPTMADFALF